jgi:hypothetical protein
MLQTAEFLSIIMWTKRKISLCLIKQCAIQTWWRERRYSSNILDFGTRWMRDVSFMRGRFYTGQRRPQHTFDRRLGGPECRPWRCGAEINSCICRELNSVRPARSLSPYRWATPSPIIGITIKSYPRNRPWRPIWSWDFKNPSLYRQSAHR